MSEAEGFQLIVDVLRSTSDLRSRVSIDQLNTNTQLRKEMGFDSIGLVALFCELQDRHPHLQEEMVSEWVTIGDCVNSIIKK